MEDFQHEQCIIDARKLQEQINTLKDIMKQWGRQLLELKRLAHTHFDPYAWDQDDLQEAEIENENGVRR